MISFTSAPAGVFVFLSVIILWLLKKIHVLRAKDVCGSSRKSLGICRGVCAGGAGFRPPQGFALGFYRPGVSPLAMIRRPYRAHGYPHQQTNRAARPEWDVPGRAVGPVDHSPGRNPGRRNPGAQRHTPPKRAPGPEWMNARGRVFAPCRGARWGVFNTPLHGDMNGSCRFA